MFFAFRFPPPLFVPLAAVALAVPSIVYYILWIVDVGKDSSVVKASVIPGIRGYLLLVVNQALCFRFVSKNRGFDWFAVGWDHAGVSGGGTAVVAVIPDIISGTGDMFGARLTSDIIDNAIAFVVVLGCNLFVSQYFRYDLFDLS
jgi:hypothetical protein